MIRNSRGRGRRCRQHHHTLPSGSGSYAAVEESILLRSDVRVTWLFRQGGSFRDVPDPGPCAMLILHLQKQGHDGGTIVPSRADNYCSRRSVLSCTRQKRREKQPGKQQRFVEICLQSTSTSQRPTSHIAFSLFHLSLSAHSLKFDERYCVRIENGLTSFLDDGY